MNVLRIDAELQERFTLHPPARELRCHRLNSHILITKEVMIMQEDEQRKLVSETIDQIATELQGLEINRVDVRCVLEPASLVHMLIFTALENVHE
jgi:hypothetical protein